MRFPKYQWMQEEPINDGCGFCDVLYKTQNDNDAFQVILDTANVVTDLYNTNPFDLITSNDLEFDLELSPLGNQFQLYIGGNVYIFEWVSEESVDFDEYDYTQTDNVYFIRIVDGVGASGSLEAFLNDVLDVNEGTTSTRASATFTIADVPAGSYLNNYLFVSSISTVTPSTNIGQYFYWNDNQIKYKIIVPPPVDIIYQFEQTLTTGSLNLIEFAYNSVSTSFQLTITIDDGIDPPTVYTPTVGTGGTINIDYTPTNTGVHTIELELIDPEVINSGFNLESLTISELIEVTDLEIEDCDGTITPFDYSAGSIGDILDENTMIFELQDNYPSVFRFIITDSENNTLTSRWYKVGDKDDCINGKLYSVKWTNTCNLGEIDYSGLPFTNELLLSGVLIKTQNDLLDSIENITASGKKISIYKNTQSVYEFRMNPYLSETFEDVLEGIFMHDTVTINGTKYNATDTVQTSELDLQVYTGRVDLYKDGTNLISKTCC